MTDSVACTVSLPQDGNVWEYAEAISEAARKHAGNGAMPAAHSLFQLAAHLRSHPAVLQHAETRPPVR